MAESGLYQKFGYYIAIRNFLALYGVTKAGQLPDYLLYSPGGLVPIAEGDKFWGLLQFEYQSNYDFWITGAIGIKIGDAVLRCYGYRTNPLPASTAWRYSGLYPGFPGSAYEGVYSNPVLDVCRRIDALKEIWLGAGAIPIPTPDHLILDDWDSDCYHNISPPRLQIEILGVGVEVRR